MKERTMKVLITCAAAFGLLLAAPARAADHESAKGAVHEALEAQADAPKTPPTLPDQASARAKLVQKTIAHGKKGAAERAAHAKSGDVDSEAARHADSDTDSDAANKSAQGAAASAARSANSDSHAAAGQAQATKSRGGNPPGSGPGGHGHGHDASPNPNPNPSPNPNPNPNPGHGH
jgi:hypothetical protein